MKKLIILCVFLVSPPALVVSQSFTEWTKNGWGFGLNNTHPTIIDIDSDGLLDLFVGSYSGNIAHFEQTSLNSNSFALRQQKFNNINIPLFPAPTFADIDDDGLLDMIIGEWQGNLHHYEQATVNADSFLFVTQDFNGITVGKNSSPHFTDLDQDGLIDLLVGAHSGKLFLYEQQSTASENFILMTDSLKIDPPTFRINTAVLDLDQNGLFDLIIGGNYGNLAHFEQSAMGSLDFVAHNLYLFQGGDYMYGGSAPCIADFDNDGLYDLIVGEMDGLYYHFEQASPLSFDFVLQSDNFLNLMDVGAGAAPCVTDLDADGLVDLIVGEWHGNLNHFEQATPASMNFVLVTDTLGSFDVGDYSLPAFIDLDADGLLDLIVGEREGTLNHFEQDPDNPDEFNLIAENMNDINLPRYAAPCFSDLDGDGLMDMIIGEETGKLHLYEQQNTNSYTFDLIIDSLNVKVNEGQPTPYIIDYDADGLLDLFIGESDGTIHHYEQNAANSRDFVSITAQFANIDVGQNARIAFADITGDGELDLICGDANGGLHLYINQSAVNVHSSKTGTQKSVEFALFANHPNPFNSSTSINYHIPETAHVTIELYNVRGQKIKTLVNGKRQAGSHIMRWDATNDKGEIVGSGIYLLYVRTDDRAKSIKLSFVK